MKNAFKIKEMYEIYLDYFFKIKLICFDFFYNIFRNKSKAKNKKILKGGVKEINFSNKLKRSGLKNLGNTCYLASLLQLLASTFHSINSSLEGLSNGGKSFGAKMIALLDIMVNGGDTKNLWKDSFINAFERKCGLGYREMHPISKLLELLGTESEEFGKRFKFSMRYPRQCQSCLNWHLGSIEEIKWLDVSGPTLLHGVRDASPPKRQRGVDGSFCNHCQKNTKMFGKGILD